MNSYKVAIGIVILLGLIGVKEYFDRMFVNEITLKDETKCVYIKTTGISCNWSK